MSRKATNITLFDQALVSGTNFLTGLLLARFLGIETYGLYVLLSGVILFAWNIQNAVIISPLMALAPARNRSASARFHKSLFLIQIVFAIVIGTCILTITSILNYTLLDGMIEGLALPLTLATIGLICQEYFRRYFFTTDSSSNALVNDTLSYALQLVSLITYEVMYGLDIASCLYIMAATSAIAVFHGLLASGLLREDRPVSRTDIVEISLEIWLFGRWLLAKNITYWLGTQMVIYATGILLSVTVVGAMGAARNIVGIANILFLAVDNFATPRASRAFSVGGMPGLRKYISRVSKLGAYATAAIVGVAVAAPELLLTTIYTDEYAGYGWVVVAWSVFYFIGYFQRPTGIALRVTHQTRAVFIGAALGTVTALLVTFPAIYYWGLGGAMSALIMTQLTISATYFYLYIHISPKPDTSSSASTQTH